MDSLLRMRGLGERREEKRRGEERRGEGRERERERERESFGENVFFIISSLH